MERKYTAVLKCMQIVYEVRLAIKSAIAKATMAVMAVIP